MLSALFFIVGIVLVLALVAGGAQWLDNRELRLKARARRVKALERTLHVVENAARDEMIVNPHSSFPAFLLTEINKAMRTEIR